jgi:hypothetical protein
MIDGALGDTSGRSCFIHFATGTRQCGVYAGKVLMDTHISVKPDGFGWALNF